MRSIEDFAMYVNWFELLNNTLNALLLSHTERYAHKGYTLEQSLVLWAEFSLFGIVILQGIWGFLSLKKAIFTKKPKSW